MLTVLRGTLTPLGMAMKKRSPLLNNLVAYWKLEEATGTRVDATGRGNDLTDNNTVGQAVGKIGNCAQFVSANSEYLSILDNADVRTGDIDWTIGFWCKLDNKTDHRVIIAKDDLGTQREYSCYYHLSLDRIIVEFQGTNYVKADNLGSPVLNTWYGILFWHDSVANQICIRVNNGAANTVTTTVPGATKASQFRIGAFANSVDFLGGLVDSVGIWKRLLSADEQTEWYNNGNGNEYPFAA